MRTRKTVSIILPLLMFLTKFHKFSATKFHQMDVEIILKKVNQHRKMKFSTSAEFSITFFTYLNMRLKFLQSIFLQV